jgi:hypothetical protein
MHHCIVVYYGLVNDDSASVLLDDGRKRQSHRRDVRFPAMLTPRLTT